MGEFLELWIITPEGLTMFNARAKGVEESVNPNLLSGFINAVRGMLQVSEDAEIEAMNLSGQKLIFYVVNLGKPLLFIGRVFSKVKDKNVKKDLAKIAEEFKTKYLEQIKQWNCDVSVFDGFELAIKDFLFD